MRKLFKTIFGLNNTKLTQVEPEVAMEEHTKEHKIEMDKDLLNVQPQIEKQADRVRKETEFNDFEKILNRDHRIRGYRDGYDYQDVNLIPLYKELMISEAEEILIEALRELDLRILNILKYNDASEDLNQTLKAEIKMIKLEHENKRQFLIDMIELTADGAGPISRALVTYESGFTRGFIDKNKSHKLSKTYNY